MIAAEMMRPPESSHTRTVDEEVEQELSACLRMAGALPEGMDASANLGPTDVVVRELRGLQQVALSPRRHGVPDLV